MSKIEKTFWVVLIAGATISMIYILLILGGM